MALLDSLPPGTLSPLPKMPIAAAQLPLSELIYMVGFGPHVNCTVELCPLSMSVTTYKPNLSVNVLFLALFVLAGGIHAWLGLRWRSWWYMSCCVTCCVSAVIGYVARSHMFFNVFSFYGFLVQGIFLTIVPVFYCAGIYVTLAQSINFLAPELARFSPRLIPIFFLPCDVVALTLQSAGAMISSTADVTELDLVHTGEQVSIVGLVLQLATMCVFSVLFLDFGRRYFMTATGAVERTSRDTRIRIFFGAIVGALLLTVARSAYRIAELYQGYTGTLMKEEGPFILLEGAAVIISVFLLMIGHPGYVFQPQRHLPSVGGDFQELSDEKGSSVFSKSAGAMSLSTLHSGRFDEMERRMMRIESMLMASTKLAVMHSTKPRQPTQRFDKETTSWFDREDGSMY